MRGKASSGDHWVTINSLPSGYVQEYTYKIFSQNASVPNTQMLYQCVTNSARNFISQDVNCENYTFVQALGYIYNTSQPNTATLYRCLISSPHIDHFISSYSNCGQVSNAVAEAIIGYYLIGKI